MSVKVSGFHSTRYVKTSEQDMVLLRILVRESQVNKPENKKRILLQMVLSAMEKIKCSMGKSIVGTGERLTLLAIHHRHPKGGGIGSERLQDRGGGGERGGEGQKSVWEPARGRVSGHYS